MQEVFNNIVEKFQSKIEALGGASGSNEVQDVAVKEIEWCKEIVEKFAKEFATDTNVGSNGWISVSDHIPVPAKKSFGNKQKRTNVLVTLRNGLVKEMTFEFETNEFWEVGDDNHIEHWKEDAIDTDAEVIAWQPLPQPYQPKGE